MDLPEKVNGLSISDIILEAKKKNRRKPRTKKNKHPDLDCSILTDCKIEAVTDKTMGTVVRKRNIKCQQINLDTFTNDTNKPFIVNTSSNALLTIQKKPCDETPLSSKSVRHKFKTISNISITPTINGVSTDIPDFSSNINHPNFIKHDISPSPKNDSYTNKASTSAAPVKPRYQKFKDKPKGNHINHNNSAANSSDLQSPKRHRNRKMSDRTPEKQSKFETYFDEDTVLAGLKLGLLIQGTIRINPKFYTDAYITNVDRSIQDYLVGSVAERNRALEGDMVYIKVKPEKEWRDNQKTAEVVYIKEKVHPRMAIGFLSVLRDSDKRIATLMPRDKRVPRLNIVETSLPQNFFQNPKQYEDVLFMAQIVDWVTPKYAVGMITENVGKSNDLKAETRALLLENQLDFRPFPPSMEKYLPQSKAIPAKELEYREDFRGECVFTIDPLTARDLDDALSCKRLPNGNFEIGVHIADVTFHLEENTELDNLVSKKATTIYLVDNVYHMLPPQLCMHCSLLPGHDNLAFSVIWEMTPQAEIVSTRFARTIINSCTQFAYEHAQLIIDDSPALADPTKFPKIHNGFDLEHIKTVVRDLQSLALKMREVRTANGALKINQIKLGFALDAKGNPQQFYVQEIKEANRLIEEFMLMANISVAKKIYAAYPQMAFLRCHEEPNMRLLGEVQKNLEILGLHINVDSAGDLQHGLEKYNSNDFLGSSHQIVLNHMLAKPMTRAVYFCANSNDPSTFHHYALSIPIYTHFTSPIRRYADIMVHRLLSASLGYSKAPKRPICDVIDIAENCNKQKYNAKKAGDASLDLYLAHYVEQHQPFIRDGVIVAVQEKAFDVIIMETGSNVRVYTNSFDKVVKCKTEQYGEGEKKLWRSMVVYPATNLQPAGFQMIDVFQIVKVALTRKEKTNSLEATLIRPYKLL